MGKKLSVLQIISIIMIVLGAILILVSVPLVQQTIVKVAGLIETEMPQLNVNMLVSGAILVILGGILWKIDKK